MIAEVICGLSCVAVVIGLGVGLAVDMTDDVADYMQLIGGFILVGSNFFQLVRSIYARTVTGLSFWHLFSITVGVTMMEGYALFNMHNSALSSFFITNTATTIMCALTCVIYFIVKGWRDMTGGELAAGFLYPPFAIVSIGLSSVIEDYEVWSWVHLVGGIIISSNVVWQIKKMWEVGHADGFSWERLALGMLGLSMLEINVLHYRHSPQVQTRVITNSISTALDLILMAYFLFILRKNGNPRGSSPDEVGDCEADGASPRTGV